MINTIFTDTSTATYPSNINNLNPYQTPSYVEIINRPSYSISADSLCGYCFSNVNPIFSLIKSIYFGNPSNPVTVIRWKDGSRTVVKCLADDNFSPEIGFSLCVMKKMLGNKDNYKSEMKKIISKFVDIDKIKCMCDGDNT